jgi:hypothetical protein
MSEDNAQAACEYALLKLGVETLHVSPTEHQVSTSRLFEIAERVRSERYMEDDVEIRWRGDGTLYFARRA